MVVGLVAFISSQIVFWHFVGKLLPYEWPTTATETASESIMLSGKIVQGSIKRVKSIAYAISIVSCPINTTGPVLDGPAVLAHSIHQIHAKSKYDYTLYAFLHPDAISCSDPLVYFGYQTLIRNVPIDIFKIESTVFQKLIETKGCCGSREFIKLWAYTLIQHDIVVHVDTDVFFQKPMEVIFDHMLGSTIITAPTTTICNSSGSTIYSNSSFGCIETHEPNLILSSRTDFLFTRDYLQQSTITTDPKRFGVQGGFFIARPSMAVFHDMTSLLLKGNYSEAKGWGQAYHGGYWGSSQIQGFLSYYYTTLHPEHAVELNHCFYNTMLESPRNKHGTCRTQQETCQDCRQVPFSDMYSIHLTICWKPWQCYSLAHRNAESCRQLHRAWFDIRHSLEVTMWGDDSQNPPFPMAYHPKITLGYCQRSGVKGRKPVYLPIRYPNISSRLQ